MPKAEMPKQKNLLPVDYKAAQLPNPEDVMNRPPPAIRDSKAMDEWNWWRYWAIGQTAWARNQLTVALGAQAKMREITALRARFDAVHPTVEVSRPRRIGPYQERQTEREKEILAYFKNNTYRKRDGDEGFAMSESLKDEQAIVVSSEVSPVGDTGTNSNGGGGGESGG